MRDCTLSRSWIVWTDISLKGPFSPNYLVAKCLAEWLKWIMGLRRNKLFCSSTEIGKPHSAGIWPRPKYDISWIWYKLGDIACINYCIYTPVSGVSNPEANRACGKSACIECVMIYGYCHIFLERWVMAEWLGRSTQWWVEGSSVRLWGPGFATGMQHMKRSAYNLNLLCCQCMETCSYVSSIQKWCK